MATNVPTGTATPVKPSGWKPGAPGPRVIRAALITLGAAGVVIALAYSSSDVSGTRLARPQGSYVPPRIEFLGISNWYAYFQVAAVVMFAAIWIISLYQSIKRGKPTPTLIMTAVTTAMTALDPALSWAPYFAYDPRMFHVNVDWFWISAAPTVVPWAVIIGYSFFFLIPAWTALAVYKRLAARVSPESWMVRRPVLGVLAVSIPTAMMLDAIMEILFLRMGFLTYTQVIPFGTLFAGHPWQYPLWEAVFFGLVISPAAPLMWTDNRGRTWPEKFAGRFKIFNGRPHIGAFVVAFTLMSAVYLAYGLIFGMIRASGIATQVADTWRYPETSVYDPQGYYEKAGVPGPYFPGTWGGWELRR